MRRGVEHRPAAGVVGVLGLFGEDLGGEGAGRGALAGPARPAEEVGVRGPGAQSGRERQARPRLVLGRLLEHGHPHVNGFLPAYREERRSRLMSGS